MRQRKPVASAQRLAAQCAAMTLKLFRSTEFAQSRNFSPVGERRALHPVWLILLAAFWIAVPGNWALWNSLSHTPGIGIAMVAWIGLRLVLLLGFASAALLSLLMWRWTTKLAIGVALLVTALASITAGNLPGPTSWQGLLCLVILALLPCIWLWRARLRRVPVARNLLQVALVFVAAVGLFALVLAFSFKDLARLSDQAPGLRSQVSPFSALGSVRALEQVLLRRQQ